MRTSSIVGLMSGAILTGGAVLTAVAQDLSARPRDRCSMTFPIEPGDPSTIRKKPAADSIRSAKRSAEKIMLLGP